LIVWVDVERHCIDNNVAVIALEAPVETTPTGDEGENRAGSSVLP
jgi:hypothetical protein